jgi:exopolysaccharide biosynthesis protein
MFRGVEFAAGEADTNEVRQHKVFALRVDLADPTVEFFSTPANGDGPLETYGQTTTTFVQTYAVAAGVNANFFSPVSTTPDDPRDLSGLAVSQGDVVSPFESGRPAVLVSRSNQVSFAQTAPSSLTNVWTAVAGSDRILINGVAQLQGCNTSFCNENPRTAVGLSQDARYFYLMVIDGRRTGWSDGATLYETGQWLLRLGAWNGLNLDGGGSTAMATLTNGTAVLLNRPSGGVQRVDGNHLGVFAQSLVPVIVTQPTNQTVPSLQSATFSVAAAGSPPLYYQWRFNGTNLSAATAASYTIMAIQPADAGSYSVVVSNAFGLVVSSNAGLSVIPLPTVLTAGNNDFGQLDVPTAASNLVAIAAGGSHSLALRADGTVLAWGSDLDGEGTAPMGLTNAVAIAAGGYHNLALDAAGEVIAWGANDYGQTTVPGGLRDVYGLAAGTWHSLALQRDGHVAAWGDNSAGQTSVPPGLSNVVRIAAGGNHSLALTAGGAVVAWGDNLDAHGTFAGQSTVPPGLSNVVGIAAGAWHSLALDAAGRVHGWGANDYGQATPPAGLTNAVAIVAGGLHSAALCQDGKVVFWGNNWNGQCELPGAPMGILALAAGDYHTLALPADNPLPVKLFRPQRQNDAFSVLLQTDMLGRYSLQQGNSLPLPVWTELPPVNGNGSLLQLVDPSATNASSYYRVRRW